MRPFLFLAGVWVCLQTAALASERQDSLVRRLLLRSVLAHRSVNLEGTLTEYVPDGDRSISRTVKHIVRRSDGRVFWVCADPPAERGATHEESGGWSRSYDPHTNRITVSRCTQAVRNQREAECLVRRIMANYQVRYLGDDHIANRPCYILFFQPRDPYAHSIQVWLDKDTGVTLSREEKNARGGTLVGSLYTSVSFPASIPDSRLKGRYPTAAKTERTALSDVYHNVGPLRRVAGFEVTLPTAMPAGYWFDSCEMVLLRGVRNACLRYTDGVAMVDVFESKADPRQAVTGMLLKRLPRGETLAVKVHGGTTCVVVGPRETEGILMVARSLDVHVERQMVDHLSRTAHVPLSKLANLRNRGLGFDAVAALADISAQTGRRLDTLVEKYCDGWGWLVIASQLKANVPLVAARCRPYECR